MKLTPEVMAELEEKFKPSVDLLNGVSLPLNAMAMATVAGSGASLVLKALALALVGASTLKSAINMVQQFRHGKIVRALLANNEDLIIEHMSGKERNLAARGLSKSERTALYDLELKIIGKFFNGAGVDVSKYEDGDSFERDLRIKQSAEKYCNRTLRQLLLAEAGNVGIIAALSAIATGGASSLATGFVTVKSIATALIGIKYMDGIAKTRSKIHKIDASSPTYGFNSTTASEGKGLLQTIANFGQQANRVIVAGSEWLDYCKQTEKGVELPIPLHVLGAIDLATEADADSSSYERADADDINSDEPNGNGRSVRMERALVKAISSLDEAVV